MSMMLNLVDRLRNLGTNYQKLGRDRDAYRVWKRLAAFRSLPAELLEEAHVHLAELRLARQQFRRARRHLAVALLYRPDSARYHLLMARALNSLDHGDPERAAEHYRRSVELDANQPRTWAEVGLLAVDLGNVEEGIAALRRAAELADDDAAVLALVVEGLCLAERADEARQVLLAARFRHPRDRRILKLWNDLQYDELHEAQEQTRQQRPRLAVPEEPTLLPFVRPTLNQPRLRIRRDPPQPLPLPHRPRRAVQPRTAR